MAEKKKQTLSFEERMRQLEERIARMESGGSGLAEMLSDYEWCSEQIALLERELTQAQQRLTILHQKEDGSQEELPLKEEP